MRPDAHSPAPFENRNRQPSDISRFSTAEYERDRCQTTMAALARRYYAEAYEPKCSSGELTAQLARVCAHVTATDIAPSAVARARQRCAHLHNVNIYRADIAQHEPVGGFDLIVLSERGYYFAPSDLIRAALKLCDSLASGGELVAVHWLGIGQDHVLHGDAVHSLLLANLPLQWLKGDRQRGFRMDSWLRI
jgi:trans-aconitate methyltransferase